MHDVVVVGAGPAGSRYARRAAERGQSVLVFEQGEVGEPLACSGHVSTDIWEYTEGARETLLQNEISGARFHTGGPDSDAHPFYKDEVISNVIDRVGLDRHLAELAREAGADLREHHTVVAVAEHRDHVTVDARGPDGDVETYRAKLVAGCDGPKSRVRRELGLPEPDELLHGVLGFDETPDHQEFVDVHLTVPTFFAWRIPRGEAGVEYGLAVPPGDDASGRFEAFCAGYDADVSRRCSGLIPIGPPKRVTGSRSFLVGDAAAQTKPFTGGGILYGMTAADHAAREIDPDDPATLGDYERAWRDDLRGDIRLGHAVRAGYSVPEAVQKAGMTAFEGEIGVHMDRPSTLFSREQLKALLSRS
ncbi:geranylgeranyl reductase family protein [Haloarcula laminariae]|uniref:geranylgeranyl reductase family protein n=1 Tax=Haloarcula laminariae TaxID=2961577 RepID=UPI0021C5E7CB|nr:geranylgeranyl reductase family protein [Halomicroarcula laminariae]